MTRIALLAAILLASCCTATAEAQIVPQRGMKGLRLGMTVAEVRTTLGAPDRISFRRDEIQGRVRVYAYGLTRVAFSPGDDARVTTLATTSRSERTSRGIGVGSTRAAVARKVPGVHCRVEYGLDHCAVGSATPGHAVTDFLIGARGRVQRVVVGYVID
jgi:hypothetical protein